MPEIYTEYPGGNNDRPDRNRIRRRITILTPHLNDKDHDNQPIISVEDSDNISDPSSVTDKPDTDNPSVGDVVTIDYDMSDEELFNTLKEQLNSIADKYKDLMNGQLSFQGLFGWISLYNIIFKHGRDGLEEYLDSVFQEIKEKIKQTAKDRANRQYVILADGSIFIVKDSSYTNYFKYWKVYYDTIRVPACQNIFHMIKEQKHVLKSYSYVSGPTTSLQSEDYWIEKDYCTGYEMHETINIFWDEGDVFFGDKPKAVYFPTDNIDPLKEAFEKMKSSLGTIMDDGKSVKVKRSLTNDEGSQTITETSLPASFFTQPHTLNELINLGLIVGDFNTAELNRLMGPKEVDFIIEIYGVKK